MFSHGKTGWIKEGELKKTDDLWAQSPPRFQAELVLTFLPLVACYCLHTGLLSGLDRWAAGPAPRPSFKCHGTDLQRDEDYAKSGAAKHKFVYLLTKASLWWGLCVLSSLGFPFSKRSSQKCNTDHKQTEFFVLRHRVTALKYILPHPAGSYSIREKLKGISFQ